MRILAIDQSYAHTGLALVDGGYIGVYSFDYPKEIRKIEYGGETKRPITKKDKRHMLVKHVNHLVQYKGVDLIVVERVRLHAHGRMSPATTKALHAMVIAIADNIDVPVRSIDTRAWKSKVLGNASATKDDAVQHVCKLLQLETIDHDSADAVCMALAVQAGAKVGMVE